MKLSKVFHIRKYRKYPIKRDNEGLSLRARCFELFEQGKRPAEVTEELKMEVTTVRRYFRDWKRLGPNFERKYAYVKSLFIKDAPDRDKNMELFSNTCGISKEQFEISLSQPHGLRRLLTGKYHFPAHADADHKRHIALELAILITDFLFKKGGKFGDIYSAFKHYMQEAKEQREEEDADIEEENKTMALIHRVLAADMENERLGRVQPDALSEEERNALIRCGIESEMKKTEQFYWLRVGIIMAGGLTREQAREKIYQDILDKGDSKVAKMFREFQDKIHPLKNDDQLSPSTPLPPASSM
jgi:Sec-independent protein translocase protein TatA